MVEFIETTRKMCRKCRGKLQEPTSNDRSAFCCRGCYDQWYRKRCRVCEDTIAQGEGRQRILCKKPKCRAAWKQKAGFGRFLKPITPNPTRAPSDARMGSEPPGFIELERASGGNRPWQMTAYGLTRKIPTEVLAAEGWSHIPITKPRAADLPMPLDYVPEWLERLVPREQRMATRATANRLPDIGDGLDIPEFLRRSA